MAQSLREPPSNPIPENVIRRWLFELELTLPTSYVVVNPDTLTDTEQLAHWIDSIPSQDHSSLADQLLTSIKLLNRDPRPLANRLSLANVYLEPLAQLIQRIRQLNVSAPSATLKPTDTHFVERTSELCRELGYAYKRVLKELAEAPRLEVAPEHMSHVLYWASQSLAFELMFAFADYRPEPHESWREMVRLFLLARRLKIARHPVTDPGALTGTHPSVDLAFRRAAMISMLDPYNLRRGDAWCAYDYLSHHAMEVTIGTFRATESDAGFFLIDMKGHNRPQALRLDNLPPRPREFLLVNVNALNAVVHRHYRMLDINPDVEIEGLFNQEGGRAMYLFRSMLTHWHNSPNRRNQRIEEYDWLTVTCGLNNICNQLARLSDDGETFLAVENTLEPIPGVDRDVSCKDHRWRQVDFSGNGVGVVLPSADARSIQVGEIVLTRSEQFEGMGRRHVGIIRRLVRRDDDYMEAGIQFLAGRIIPTHIHHRDRPMPVLIVERARSQERVLITPPGVHRAGRILEVKTGPRTAYTVKTDKLLEATCCVERFDIKKR